MVNVEELCKKARIGSYKLAEMDAEERNSILLLIADALESASSEIILANSIDLTNLNGKDDTFRDRLTLTERRIADMCLGVRQLVSLPDPIGEVVEQWETARGLTFSKIRSPLGVVAVIYEARPNVTVDVVGVCVKTGNAIVLRGGKDAINTNRKLYSILSDAINSKYGQSDYIQFVDDVDRQATYELLKQGKFVDVIIPRGGNTLKELVLANATMPVIASAGGNCHIYIHSSADIDKAIKIVINAKVQRPTVCNACEQVLVDKSIAKDVLPKLFAELRKNCVIIKGDELCLNIDDSIELAKESDYYEEHLSLLLSIKTVNGVAEAVSWINTHNTSHSDAIIAEDKNAQEYFAKNVDSGCIYINASTRFTDGFEFGFGAEIGISTQKLHARGPLGLKQLTSEKYIVKGDGTIR